MTFEETIPDGFFATWNVHGALLPSLDQISSDDFYRQHFIPSSGTASLHDDSTAQQEQTQKHHENLALLTIKAPLAAAEDGSQINHGLAVGSSYGQLASSDESITSFTSPPFRMHSSLSSSIGSTSLDISGLPLTGELTPLNDRHPTRAGNSDRHDELHDATDKHADQLPSTDIVVNISTSHRSTDDSGIHLAGMAVEPSCRSTPSFHAPKMRVACTVPLQPRSSSKQKAPPEVILIDAGRDARLAQAVQTWQRRVQHACISKQEEEMEDERERDGNTRKGKEDEESDMLNLGRTVEDSITSHEHDEVSQLSGITLRDMAVKVAEWVNDVMGGMGEEKDMHVKWAEEATKLREDIQSAVIPIGRMNIGLNRHRCLLFKVKPSQSQIHNCS